MYVLILNQMYPCTWNFFLIFSNGSIWSKQSKLINPTHIIIVIIIEKIIHVPFDYFLIFSNISISKKKKKELALLISFIIINKFSHLITKFIYALGQFFFFFICSGISISKKQNKTKNEANILDDRRAKQKIF